MKNILKSDKRGFAFTLGLIIILGVISLIMAIAFLVSSQIRWILLGVGLIIGGIYLIANLKSDKFKLLFGFVLFGGALFLIFGSGLLQTTYGDRFVNPDWARLECVPTDAYEGLESNTLNNQLIYKCDANTRECRIMVEHTTQGTFVTNLRTNYRICDLSECTSWQTLKLDDGERLSSYIDIKVGKQIEFIEDGLDEIGYKYGKVTIEWRDWKIYRFVGGAKFEVVSNSCSLPSSSRSNIPEGETPASGVLSKTGGEGDKWVNYVNAWNFGPATNVFSHPDYGEVYCNAGQIFDIVELRMEDGSLKKLDPEYSDTREDGERPSGRGTKLSNVECCPNEPNCGNDFKFIPVEDEEEEKECFTDSQCLNAGGPVPISGGQYVVYQCIDGSCQKSNPIDVECTSNAQCEGDLICDLSTTNYGNCVESDIGEYCGDGICQNDESAETCPSDCAKETSCSWYQEPYTKEEKDYKLWNYIGIGEPDTYEVSGCKTATWVFWTIGGLVVLILGITTIIIYMPKRKRRKR